jgi:hypothetical protein
MKKLYQYTMILLAGVVGACSSLEVSDPYSENLPSDFSAEMYRDIHPYLHTLQIKDYVKARNAFVKDSLEQLGINYNEFKAQDDESFKAMDPNLLAAICKDPHMGTKPEASCVNVAANTDIMKELIAFNLVAVADDYTALSSFPVDFVAISQQYVVFGRSHGWAYRWCSEAESQDLEHHPVRDNLPIANQQGTTAETPESFVPDTGLYCRDAAGNDRLIQ